jgi:hypothetical protein
VQNLFNSVGIWRHLPRAGAYFLLQSIAHFESDERTRGRLTALHWAGSGEETGAANLFRPGGWASACAGSDQLSRRRELRSNWLKSESEGNLWFHFLPHPVREEDNFFNTGMISQLLTDETCQGSQISAYAHIYHLFDGGLCNLARLRSEWGVSAADIHQYVFGSARVRVRSSCEGFAQQMAMHVALAVGGSATSMGDSLSPAMSGTSGSLLNVSGGGGVVLSMAVGIGAGVVSAIPAYYLGKQMGEDDCEDIQQGLVT